MLQAQTTLANARTNLSYTTITSPVNGVAGMIPYKLGSLVTSTTAQPLTMISNISNVYAYFSMNEKQLLQFSRQYKGSTVEAKLKQLPPVALILSDKTEYPEKGRIEAIERFDQFRNRRGDIPGYLSKSCRIDPQRRQRRGRYSRVPE